MNRGSPRRMRSGKPASAGDHPCACLASSQMQQAIKLTPHPRGLAVACPTTYYDVLLFSTHGEPSDVTEQCSPATHLLGSQTFYFQATLDLSLECAGLQQLSNFSCFFFFSPLTLLPTEFLLTLGSNTDIPASRQCNLRNAAEQGEEAHGACLECLQSPCSLGLQRKYSRHEVPVDSNSTLVTVSDTYGAGGRYLSNQAVDASVVLRT